MYELSDIDNRVFTLLRLFLIVTRILFKQFLYIQGTEKQHLSKDTDGKTIIKVNDPSSAYLGPKLWDKQISLDLGLDLDSSADEGAAGPSGSGERNSGDASGYGVSSGMSPGFAGISIQVHYTVEILIIYLYIF